jgi:Fanconi anemia group M protein
MSDQTTIPDFLGESRTGGSRHFRAINGWISHPLIKESAIEAREFQTSIAEKALSGNLMIVIPTGLGKTIIATLVSAELLLRNEKKVLFLAPTKPLVNQHLETFQRLLTIEEMVSFTGSVSAKKRSGRWNDARVIFSTPQVIKNDVKEKRYSLEDVSLLIFDEAHRAIGKYAYVEIAKNYVELGKSPLILALTASPGGKRKRIQEVLDNLHIRSVEARSRSDPDVVEYVKEIKIECENVRLNEKMVEIQKLLEQLLYEKIDKLHKMGFLTYKKRQYVSKKDIITTGEMIRQRMGRGRRSYLFGAVHNQAIAIHAYHCLELLETQGVKPLEDYLGRLFEKKEPSRSEKSVVGDGRVRKAYRLAKACAYISHPKIDKLKEVIERQFAAKKESLIIVFAQYRDTIASILQELESLNVKAVRFVGQASREGGKGLTQKEQKEILDNFRNGTYNVLVASSVAEEGLDIPSVDLVVFYEPIPSEIRAIQRRGRTGRSDIGRVVILIARDTRDEAYLHAEMSREEKMKRIVKWLGKKRG